MEKVNDMEFDITVKMQGNTLDMKLSGKLNYNTASEFDKEFADLLNDVSEIRIDMSDLVYISSFGIRSLIVAKRLADTKGVKLLIVSPSQPVTEVLEMTGTDKVIDIISPEDDNSTAALYPLRPIQRLMLDTQFMKARSTMMNTGALVSLEPAVDLHILAKVVNSVIEDNDIFRCRFVIDDKSGEVFQRFDGAVKPVIVEEMTSEDFEKNKGCLRVPYEVIDHQLWNIRIIRTPDTSYFFFDFFHGIMDGVAIVMIFLRDINKRYTALTSKGEIGANIRHGSSYAAYIEDEMKKESEPQAEGTLFWDKMTAGFDPEKHLPPMDNKGGTGYGHDEFEVPVNTVKKSFFQGKEVSEHSFFLGAAILTIAKMTHRQDVIMAWVHSGRTAKSDLKLMGIMLEEYPIHRDIEPGQTSSEFLNGIQNIVKESMEHRGSLSHVYNSGVEDNTACFILQKGALGRRGEIKLGNTVAKSVPLLDSDKEQSSENTMDIELNVNDDKTYSLVMNYNSDCYSREKMMQFTEIYCEMAAALQDESCDLYELLGL